jgi:hypothetical protein
MEPVHGSHKIKKSHVLPISVRFEHFGNNVKAPPMGMINNTAISFSELICELDFLISGGEEEKLHSTPHSKN